MQITKLNGDGEIIIFFFTLIIQGPNVLPYDIVEVKLPQLHWIL